ncbi:MAG: DUF1640 domain-containing protein [SAR324 cluster bacterium]|nr:DUF1640 domain-containing protein [SAR324 cluster bacterium]
MLAFDTHHYIKSLMAVGVSMEQAEVQADTLKTILMHDAVTKPDLELAKTELQRDIKALDARIETTKKELDARIETTRLELQHDLKELELRLSSEIHLLKWMTGLMLVGVIALIVRT